MEISGRLISYVEFNAFCVRLLVHRNLKMVKKNIFFISLYIWIYSQDFSRDSKFTKLLKFPKNILLFISPEYIPS